MKEIEEEKREEPVFSLDIGTRSVIGIIGCRQEDKFKVLLTEREEYQCRAVVDGQIEDIGETAKIVEKVKGRLEEKYGKPLKEVYIAAAGRVLKTVEAEGEGEVPQGQDISAEFISRLEMAAVQNAYGRLMAELDEQEQIFFCVGHGVKNYELDGYQMSTILGHRGKSAAVRLIATFLPKTVVESLYATMSRCGLKVAGLTLEPIAAMNAIIPADIRKLNLALCDIGAGTSDIALCDKGAVTAYTMATVAGDEITEAVMESLLVDFATAEEIKMRLTAGCRGVLNYQDVLGLTWEKEAAEVFEGIHPVIQGLADTIAEKILEANGRPPAAVFLVGGGSHTPGLDRLLAHRLSMDEKRVAIGGSFYLQKRIIAGEDVFGPEYATPLGIALTALQQREQESFAVTVNGERLHLMNSWDTSVLGILQMAGYQYNQILAPTGESLLYKVNGEARKLRGGLAGQAEIRRNGKPAALWDPVEPGDTLEFQPATPGKDAVLTLEELCRREGLEPGLYRLKVNGKGQPLSYPLAPGDEVEAVKAPEKGFPRGAANISPATEKNAAAPPGSGKSPGKAPAPAAKMAASPGAAPAVKMAPVPGTAAPAAAVSPPGKEGPEAAPADQAILVTLNGRQLLLPPRQEEGPYQFFDLLPFTDIDPQHPQGKIVQKLNGLEASYLDLLQTGDEAEIYWNKEWNKEKN
ncbi:MAG: cell division FtsA domain-containing protein [Peptococcaceae bacterium]|nr:cell division FtsA domain-containing protein [Peptococcaceae bacterium]